LISLTAKDDSVSFAVRAVPRASRSGVAGEQDGALKVRLAAPPVDGEANAELIRVLADFFNVSCAKVSVIAGHSSKNKIIRIHGISIEACEKALNQQGA
jgi:uncharacterized protein (TIGR00251 family)